MEPLERKMQESPSSENVSTKLQRIAKLARQMPAAALTSLSHHIDASFLREAFRFTRKNGAVGVDGQTAAMYAADLESNLVSLLDRFKSGTYRAPPVRRVYIPKDKHRVRPIGIPSFEDKVLQRAVAMVLEAVYEQDFLDCSYGFRPGRSQHQALTALQEGIMSMRGGWLIELDIQSFFDALDFRHLRTFLDQRVRDGVLRRTIDKWLSAGVMEDGVVQHPSSGSPQGGVVSPILSNVYLHEVLDVWFERMVKPVLHGQGMLVRFADDAVLVFSLERDARRVLKALPKRFSKYGLTLHPEKTRLVPFVRPPYRPPRGDRDARRWEPFDMLGFTHRWVRSRRGNWVVGRKTAKGRLQRAIARVGEWCRRNRHLPVRVQQAELSRKLQGHYGYYGITGNALALVTFFRAVTRLWRYWLDRRAQSRTMSWPLFNRLLKGYPLPGPVVVHSIYRCVAKP
jgi:group II intron reverse transcriptase/maturase